MPVFTKTAAEVFDPLTGGGAPRGANMSEARTWGTEVEGALPTPEDVTDLTITAETPGTMSITYNDRVARAIKMDKTVHLFGYIDFTCTSLTGASGDFQIANLPYVVDDTTGVNAFRYTGSVLFRGSGNNSPTWPANTTQIVAVANHQDNVINIHGQGSNIASATGLLPITGFTVGDRYILRFSVMYETP